MTDHNPLSYGTANDPRPTLGLILSHLEAASLHGPQHKEPASVSPALVAACWTAVCFAMAGALVMPA